jgi:hypothetical protein
MYSRGVLSRAVTHAAPQSPWLMGLPVGPAGIAVVLDLSHRTANDLTSLPTCDTYCSSSCVFCC